MKSSPRTDPLKMRFAFLLLLLSMICSVIQIRICDISAVNSWCKKKFLPWLFNVGEMLSTPAHILMKITTLPQACCSLVLPSLHVWNALLGSFSGSRCEIQLIFLFSDSDHSSKKNLGKQHDHMKSCSCRLEEQYPVTLVKNSSPVFGFAFACLPSSRSPDLSLFISGEWTFLYLLQA